MICKKKVSDDDVRRAYYGGEDEPSKKAASDNRNIVAAVLAKFSGRIPREDLEACGLTAVWRALAQHDEAYGQKFTTSLHRFAVWTCKQEIYRRFGRPNPNRPKTVSLHDVSEGSIRSRRIAAPLTDHQTAAFDGILECIDRLPFDWQKTVLRQYYIEGMSLKQIGEANFCSRNIATERVKRALAELQDICRGSRTG